jgi:hypothetical protein
MFAASSHSIDVIVIVIVVVVFVLVPPILSLFSISESI